MDWQRHFSRNREASFGSDPLPPPKPPGKITVAKVPGVDKLTSGQLVALVNAASAIGVPVDWLATVISFETAGTFSPSVPNRAGSGAFGLIQFMPVTARNILRAPSNDAAVAMGKAMTFEAQLTKMVVPYFRPYATRIKSLNDLYLAIFYPAAMSKADTHVIASAPHPVYVQNKGFDKDKRGFITRADVTHTVSSILAKVDPTARIEIKSGQWGQILVGIAIAGLIAYGVSSNTHLLPSLNDFKKTAGFA